MNASPQTIGICFVIPRAPKAYLAACNLKCNLIGNPMLVQSSAEMSIINSNYTNSCNQSLICDAVRSNCSFSLSFLLHGKTKKTIVTLVFTNVFVGTKYQFAIHLLNHRRCFDNHMKHRVGWFNPRIPLD